MQNSFSINQALTFKEFLSSTLYYYFTGKTFKRFLILLFIITTLSRILSLATTYKKPDFLFVISVFVPVAITILLLTVFAFITCYSIYKSKPYLFKNVSYVFTHWGVVRNGEKTEFSKPWRDITKFKETKAFFLLYVSNIDFHIIQKRMFKDSNELNSFKNLLNENIKDS